MKNSRIKRLTFMFERLSSHLLLSTPSTMEYLGVSQRVLLKDINEYILKYFDDDTIYYDPCDKVYKSKNSFLQNTTLSSQDMAVISILKAKSRDKYSDIELKDEVDKLFECYEDLLSKNIYINSSIEKITLKEDSLENIKYAIKVKKIITCNYNNKQRELHPLKIINIEIYWYLVALENNKVKTFHLNSLKDIDVINKRFTFDYEKIKNIDNSINAYFKIDTKPILVQLYIQKEVVKFFTRVALNNTQRVLKKYDDGSLDIELFITDYMEIIPTIQKYIPFVKVIEPKGLDDKIKHNLLEYIN